MSITINGSNAFFGDYSTSFEANAVVVEDLNFVVQDITSIVAKNAVSAVP